MIEIEENTIKFEVKKNEQIKFSAKISTDAIAVTTISLDGKKLSNSEMLDFYRELGPSNDLIGKSLIISFYGTVYEGDIDGVIRQSKIGFKLYSESNSIEITPVIIKALPFLFVTHSIINFIELNQ